MVSPVNIQIPAPNPFPLFPCFSADDEVFDLDASTTLGSPSEDRGPGGASHRKKFGLEDADAMVWPSGKNQEPESPLDYASCIRKLFFDEVRAWLLSVVCLRRGTGVCIEKLSVTKCVRGFLCAMRYCVCDGESLLGQLADFDRACVP